MAKLIIGQGTTNTYMSPIVKEESSPIEPIIITKEVPVIEERVVEVTKEVIKEVPVEIEKIVYVDKIVEVIKEVPVVKEVIVEKVKAVEVKVVDDKLTTQLNKCIADNDAVMKINKSYFESLQDMSMMIKKQDMKLDFYHKLYLFSFAAIIAYLIFKGI